MIFVAVIAIFTIICYVLPKRATLQIRHSLTSWISAQQNIKLFHRKSPTIDSVQNDDGSPEEIRTLVKGSRGPYA